MRIVDPDPKYTVRWRGVRYLLSPRENQILIAMGEGKSPCEICSKLGLSAKSLSTYIARLRHGFGIDTVARLRVVAIKIKFGLEW